MRSSQLNAQQRAIRNRKRFERIRPLCSYNRLTVVEARTIYKNCIALLDSDDREKVIWEWALFTALSLITGRDQSRLKNIPLYNKRTASSVPEFWQITRTRCFLVYTPPISRVTLTEVIEKPVHEALLETVKTVPFKLPLPNELTPHIAKSLRGGLLPNSTNNVRSIPEVLYAGIDRPISKTQVSSFLFFQLKATKISSAAKGYLTGSHPNEDVALYYTQLEADTILKPYLLFLNNLNIDIKSFPLRPGELVGSSLRINERTLALQLRSHRQFIETNLKKTLKSCLIVHNEIAYYTLLVLQLLTGHRHSLVATRSSHFHNLETDHLFVNDKNARLVHLPKTAKLQIEFYIEFLKLFYSHAASRPHLASKIMVSLNGSKPLLFLLSESGNRLTFERKYLKRLVRYRWPLPENFPRHHIQSKLGHRLPVESMSATIGHLMEGQAADDQYSCMAITDLKRFSDAAEKAGNDIELLPINFPFPPSNVQVNQLKPDELKSDRHPDRFWSDRRFIEACSILKWDDKFIEKLGKLSRSGNDKDNLRALILYSAITRGGLFDPKMVETLNDLLINGRIGLWAVEDTSFISLEYRVTSGPYNLRVPRGEKEIALRQLHWPVDPQTQLLIHKFLGADDISPVLHGVADAFDIIKRYFEPENTKYSIRSLSHFCRLAPWVSCSRLGAEMSYALINAAAFSNVNFCPDKASLIGIYSKPAKVKLSAQRVSRTPRGLQRRVRFTPSSVYKKIYAVLNEADSLPAARRDLDAFYYDHRDSLNAAAQYLIWWLLHKLKTVKKASAANYLSRIGKTWLRHVADQGLDEFEEADFLQCYSNIINDFKNGSEPEPKIGLLRQLHEYGMASYGWSGGNDLAALLCSGPAKSFVRTYITNYLHIYAALKAFEKLDLSNFEIIQLKLITILAYRGGLRITEILKLRIKDINPGDNWLIFIRGTKTAANKTRTSLRMSYAISWMTADESALFQEYFRNYKIGRNKSSYHLFGELGDNQMLCPRATSDIVSQALKQSMGHADIVFHSLRHTYASTMQCIIEKEWGLAEVLSGHKKAKLNAIRDSLLGHSSALGRDLYWEVANSTGHSTPGQLLMTYTHMSGLCAHKKLSKAVYERREYRDLLKSVENVRPYEIRAASYSSISSRFITKHRRCYEQIHKPDMQKRVGVRFECDFEPTLAIWRSAIGEVESRSKIEDVKARYPMFKGELEAVVGRADKLMEAGTAPGGLRYATPAKVEDQARCCLAPDLPDYPDARMLAANLSKLFIQLEKSKRGRKQTIRWCKYILRAAAASAHYLRFEDPADLSTAIKTPIDILPASHWHVELSITEKFNKNDLPHRFAQKELHWRTMLPRDTIFKDSTYIVGRKTSANQQGVAIVTIDHRDKETGTTRKHLQGVGVVVWVAYMLMILYCTDAEVEEFLEDLAQGK